jgi:hypothetical protein
VTHIRRLSLVILSAAKDLIARSFNVRAWQAAMRSFATLRTTEKFTTGNRPLLVERASKLAQLLGVAPQGAVSP